MMPVVYVAASVISSLTGGLNFELESPTEVTQAANIELFRVAAGSLSGQSLWDPYFYLRLPKEGVDVSELHFLTARIYSSAEADVLDVYYQDPNGHWGLGATLPIKRGWATYRADLRQTRWHEGSGPAGLQWGGPSKRIVSLRLDPGNQEDRWIVVDKIELTAEPTGPLGVEVEPRGRAGQAQLHAPTLVRAGEEISVKFDCVTTPPPGTTQGTALLRLLKGNTPVQAHMQTVDLSQGRVSVQHSFRFSRYSFGGKYMIDAQILELDAERWAQSPITVRNPMVGKVRPAQTKVADYRGEPALYVNGKPIPLITYLHYGGETGKLHREAASAGLKIYTDWFGASTAGNLGQVAPGVYDYSYFDSYFETVLEAVPDAYFLPHIGVVAPAWWQRAHPEECCLFSDGSRGPSSLFSKRWKEEMAADLKRLIQHLREAPYANRILGYIFYAGYTAEWQMWGTWQEASDDFSEPAVAAFREWLRRRYGTNEALQQAWKVPEVTFETAQVPSHEQQRRPIPLVRDPAHDRPVMDYLEFTSDQVADAIIHFARAAKEACRGEQIVGTYYGYMAAHGARQPICGHNALAKVLACPHIDFLMSPNMYAHRQLGGTSTFMTATESVKLHGKLWIDESDLRTYLSDPSSGYGRTETAEQTIAVTWREFSNVLTRHTAVSWFDMSGGWFSDKPMWDMYAHQLRVAQEAFSRRQPFHADIAVFTDERSLPCFAFSDRLADMVTWTIAHMPEVGATWDFYLLSDLANPDLPPYRMYVLLNAARLDEATREALMTKAARDRATVWFFYVPGYVGRDGLDKAGIERSTGMRIEIQPEGATAAYRVDPASPLAHRIDSAAPMGPDAQLSPRPIIVDDSVEILARYLDGPAAMARKKIGNVTVIYCASVAAPVQVWRELARLAGAHIWIETGDGFYTDGQYLGLHAAGAGEKVITLPWPRKVTDVIRGRLVAQKTTQIRQNMNHGETLLVRLD